jgi:hypothetical protein
MLCNFGAQIFQDSDLEINEAEAQMLLRRQSELVNQMIDPLVSDINPSSILDGGESFLENRFS